MGNSYKILIAENDGYIENSVGSLLKENGYKILTSKSIKDGNMIFYSHTPDIILLDTKLEDGNGELLLKEIRQNSDVPIIVVSDKTRETDIVSALDLGANDYIKKPFTTGEFMARVRVAIRCCGYLHTHTEIFEYDNLLINYNSRQVFVGETEIKLTRTEYNITAYLSANSNRVLKYSSIIKAIWGYSDYGSLKKLQVNVANIRKKLGKTSNNREYIENVQGVGYIMTGK